MRTLNCGHPDCTFEVTEAQLFVKHMIETAHMCSEGFYKDLVSDPELQNVIVALLLAVQTCNSPEEIGAVPVKGVEE